MEITSRLLTFADRKEIVEIVNTRHQLWGAAEWIDKPVDSYKRRSMYQSHLFFGLFKDGVLDSFLAVEPFIEDPKKISLGMIISRKGSVKRKHENGYDLDITTLYDFAVPKMIELGHIGPYYARSSTRFKPMYKNPHNILSKWKVTVLEIIPPKGIVSDPLLRKYLGDGHLTEENEVRSFDNPAMI